MHPPGPSEEADDDIDELEPQVLSYVQFRNQMTLRDWQRRRAEYERTGFGAAMARRVTDRAVRPRS
ncbi:MAG: hypothetical protein JSR36_12365 [Proteobacteria bacterium]|nr:hypothetical protein [Pseudomonadota bacterium]